MDVITSIDQGLHDLFINRYVVSAYEFPINFKSINLRLVSGITVVTWDSVLTFTDEIRIFTILGFTLTHAASIVYRLITIASISYFMNGDKVLIFPAHFFTRLLL